MRQENPPFDRGATFYLGTAIDSTDLQGVNLEGSIYYFPDRVYATGIPVLVQCVRSSSTTNLLPKLCVNYDTAYLGQRVGQHNTTTAGRCSPVDELLPAAGAVPNDLFYIVIAGPALVKTPSSAGLVIAQGDILVGITAATSGAPDAGAVTVQSLAGATALLGNQVQNRIGRAMSAATTANTNSDLLCLVEQRWF